MPLITYKFADRHTEEIEVSDEVAAAFAQLEKYEKKVERKETRRHVSFNLLMENGFDFSADDTDILDVLDKEEQEKSEWREERFRRRVLDDKKIEIFSLLTFRQADAYNSIKSKRSFLTFSTLVNCFANGCKPRLLISLKSCHLFWQRILNHGQGEKQLSSDA